MKREIIISLLIFLTFSIGNVYAHDDVIIHPEITRITIEHSILDDYLKNNLNLTGGVNTKLPSDGKKFIIDWLKEGSTAEDSPMCRASNHFFDPTKTWDTAGMSDSPWWINTYCNSWSPFYSNVTWATGLTSPTGTPIPYDAGNSHSPNMWDNARKNYYQALTTTAKTDRETYFAQTFTAIGQDLHLIQDMSVPGHVRNDFQSHLTFHGFCTNGQCSGNPTQWFGNPFEYYIQTHAGLVAAASGSASLPSFTNPRLTDFWDTRNSSSSVLGLSQLTNTRYLSDNTIPSNNPNAAHTFALPVINSTNMRICEDYEPGSTKKRKYFSRFACTTASEARTGDHFASPSLLNKAADIIPGNISTLKLWLDDNVHKTYAGELLPLSIGYSTAVLNHFFRAKMELLPAASPSVGYVIKNNSTETMIGDFRLYYDKTGDVRTEITGNGLPMLNATIGAGNQSSAVINFTAPSDAKKPGEYMLVFQGTMGNETGAVAGNIVKLPMLLVTVEPNSIAIGNVNNIIPGYYVTLNQCIANLQGLEDQYMALYHQYYNAGQYTAADDALGASNGFRLEKEKLSTEKENWGKFLSAVNGAANATARFTGGSTQTDYSGTLSALAARYYAAYLDASVTPTWDNLPTAAKNHTFIIGLLYGGNPQLLLMFNTKAGAVRDSGIANVLCKGFYFAATYFADLLPRLTVKVDGTEWVQGAQESWTGVTTNNSFSMDTVHHVDLYMSASLIDSNYAPAWGQRIRTDMKLFSFDFKIKEE